MTGFKVPAFFGSVLILVVVILQNRTPVLQLTLLGMQSRPLPLGVFVAAAVISGLLFGTVLQRTGRRPRPKPRDISRDDAPIPEFQTFRTMPNTSAADSDHEAFNFDEDEDEATQNASPESSSARSTGAKGWDTGGASSWGNPGEDGEGGFWSRPASNKSSNQSPKNKTGLASVTPINSDRVSPKSSSSSRPKTDDNQDPAIVEAEYRIVNPQQREESDEFDDEFFDDFFEENQS